MSVTEQDNRVMPAVRRNVPRITAGIVVAVIVAAAVWMLSAPVTMRVRAVVHGDGHIIVTDATGQRLVEQDFVDITSVSLPLISALEGNRYSVQVMVGPNGTEAACKVEQTGGIFNEPTERTATGPGTTVTCYYR